MSPKSNTYFAADDWRETMANRDRPAGIVRVMNAHYGERACKTNEVYCTKNISGELSLIPSERAVALANHN